MEIQTYLERLGYRGPTRPTIDVLRQLHRRHLLKVPFENLDIPLRRPIVLGRRAFYEKIVKDHRGGFCYELNGSFASLLEGIGFRVSMLSARVAMKTGGYSAEFDHMTLLVQLKERWIADVGFGDSFAEPKRLDLSGPQSDHGWDYRFAHNDGWITLSRRKGREGVWAPQYKFTLRHRKLGDFAARCRWQQTSPRSHFRQGPFCTRLTTKGRLTLTDKKFVVTQGERKVERPLKNPGEFPRLLRRHFGIVLAWPS
ncbi:MAG TPA: arylamine N-acetyltransferase [Candidatus Bathyarchaeia archaeon]|nr:arylamine N-acetyltransferase [Candidatus Bathyarchaeia archaeon]